MVEMASRSQGRHQAFHEALLTAKGDLTKEQILQIANDVGLDTKKLVAEMDNQERLAIIERNRALASDLDITGTPAFVMGDEVVPGAIGLRRSRILSHEHVRDNQGVRR